MSNPFWGEKGTKGDGYEFGTNTGRQGTFNPIDRSQAQMAIQRLKALQSSYGDRLDPQFTGDTGLAPNDAEGYSTMLNARTEAMNIKRLLGGQAPMNTRYGGEIR
jgi:hypothetical protein